MTGDAWNVSLNIIASVITGSTVWLVTKALAWRRLRRMQDFFGLTGGDECLMIVPRHASSSQGRSVHRSDAAALLELSTVLGDCRARPEVVFHDDVYQSAADKAEFCVGGPEANQRTAAHLRSAVPNLRHASFENDAKGLTISVGERNFQAELGRVEYAALVKIQREQQDRPAFLISGQTAVSNRAAARYLQRNHAQLMRTYGLRKRFCLILRVVESDTYGPSVVELAHDATSEAFSDPQSEG